MLTHFFIHMQSCLIFPSGGNLSFPVVITVHFYSATLNDWFIQTVVAVLMSHSYRDENLICITYCLWGLFCFFSCVLWQLAKTGMVQRIKRAPVWSCNTHIHLLVQSSRIRAWSVDINSRTWWSRLLYWLWLVSSCSGQCAAVILCHPPWCMLWFAVVSCCHQLLLYIVLLSFIVHHHTKEHLKKHGCLCSTESRKIM